MTRVRIRDLDVQNKDDYLKMTDLDNALYVYTDNLGYQVYNLNQTIDFDVDDNDLDETVLDTNAFWPLVSYKLYGTTRLAWLLIKLNHVDADDIFKMLKAGTTVKYISSQDIIQVVKAVNGYDGDN